MAATTALAPAATRETRSATGSSKPRVFQTVDTAPVTKRAPASGKGGSATKANTSKPRAKKAAGTGAGVTKKKAQPAKKMRNESVANKVADKVAGAALKVEGKVEGKPGKKAAGTKKMRHEKAAVKK